LVPEDILVSFDVVSLFTKIPLDKSIEVLRKRFDDNTADLAEICLKSTYFKWKGEFYEQTEGAAMGSPISPAVANIYMDFFETTALENAAYKPSMWLRYVDDTFVVWRHGREKLEEFHQFLNQIDEAIQFTKEVECGGKLPFLDVLISRREDGSLGNSVYRKPTNTNRYLHAGSHHHPAQIKGVMATMVHRSIILSDEDHRAEELNTLTEILMKNGYGREEIRKTISRRLRASPRPSENDEVDTKKKAYLPYIRGTTDKISRLLSKYDIKTIFRPQQKIRDIIRNVKEKDRMETEGVYKISCRTCQQVYVGETGRTIKTRMKEHDAAIRLGYTERSAVAEHAERGHEIDVNNPEILAKVKNFKTRIYREALEIKKHNNNFNRDQGQRISDTWLPVLSRNTNKLGKKLPSLPPPHSPSPPPTTSNI
jgi:hypothetical protein